MGAAPTQAECEQRRDAYVTYLRKVGRAAAAGTVLRDWDAFVTFYPYPQEHWPHLRTSNAIESVFAGVRLRADATKRMRQRENALYLVFKIVQRLSGSWRALKWRSEPHDPGARRLRLQRRDPPTESSRRGDTGGGLNGVSLEGISTRFETSSRRDALVTYLGIQSCRPGAFRKWAARISSLTGRPTG